MLSLNTIFSSQSDVSEIGGGEYSEQEFDDAFERMKKAAGVNSVKEVVARFQTQGKTTLVIIQLKTLSLFKV